MLEMPTPRYCPPPKLWYVSMLHFDIQIFAAHLLSTSAFTSFCLSVEHVLGSLQETDNPDLRDRAYIYWRLLSTDPDAAKEVVLAEKPVIMDNTTSLEPSLLTLLLGQLGNLSSVYHKPSEAFVTRSRLAVQRAEDLAPASFEEESTAAAGASEAMPGRIGPLMPFLSCLFSPNPFAPLLEGSCSPSPSAA